MQFIPMPKKIGQKIEVQDNLPNDRAVIGRGIIVEKAAFERKIGDGSSRQQELPDGRRWNGLAYLHDTPRDGCTCPTCNPPQLAKDAAEAQRMTYAGRRTVALRDAKIFDESRIEKSPLFANVQRQGRLL